MELKVKRLHEHAILPTKAHPGDAGWDLYALEDVELHYGTTKEIPTGVAFEIPEGYFGLVGTRSSFGVRGIVVHPGVIDSGYRGEVSPFARLSETPDALSQRRSYRVEAGDKVAQLLILPVPSIQLVEIDELSESERGTKRLGSSGR
jgi:dUTP pyrophosphatase